MKIKIGKGPHPHRFVGPIGQLTAGITKMKTNTIDMRKLAKQLAKQLFMKDCMIEFLGINFTFNKREKESPSRGAL